MSKTEGMWSGKLFKIKLDEEEKIIGREKNFENGWDGKNKNRGEVVVKMDEENNKNEGNNDKEVKDESGKENGKIRSESNREFGDEEKSLGKNDLMMGKGNNNNNSNNNDKNNNDKNNNNNNNPVEEQASLDEESANEDWDGGYEEVKSEDRNNNENNTNDKDNDIEMVEEEETSEWEDDSEEEEEETSDWEDDEEEERDGESNDNNDNGNDKDDDGKKKKRDRGGSTEGMAKGLLHSLPQDLAGATKIWEDREKEREDQGEWEDISGDGGKNEWGMEDKIEKEEREELMRRSKKGWTGSGWVGSDGKWVDKIDVMRRMDERWNEWKNERKTLKKA